ncbi:MAG: type III pantothenate kinase [Gammaproteobacteria bacterium]|nr:type III pantothenate kinase [Gammaproteobacteria bacterium]
MRLFIDIGNSHFKWAEFEGGRLGRQRRFAYQADALDSALTDAWQTLALPEEVWAANVAGPDIAETLSHWVKRHWNLEAAFVKTAPRACGVTNAYHQPLQLGVDRWAALVAARRLTKETVCVVDCGTAITLDMLAETGEHLGGFIIPGLRAMRRALKRSTHALQVPEDRMFDKNGALLAHDTESGVTIGTLYAAAALADKAIDEQSMRRDTQIRCIITGGDAPELLPLLRCTYQHVPDLVLRGVVALAG